LVISLESHCYALNDYYIFERHFDIIEVRV